MATSITTRQYGPSPKGTPISFQELDTNTLYFQNAVTIPQTFFPISNPNEKVVNAGGGQIITYPAGATITESVMRQIGGFGNVAGEIVVVGSASISGSISIVQTASFTYGTGSLTGTMTGFTTGTFVGQATGAFSGTGSGIFTGSMTGFITGTLGGVFTGSVSGSSDGLIFNGGKGIILVNSADVTGSGTDFKLGEASTFVVDGTSSLNGFLTTQNTQIGNSTTDVHGVSGSLITFNTMNTVFNGTASFNGPFVMPVGNTFTVSGPALFGGPVTMSSTLQVSGATTFNNSVTLSNTHSLNLESGPLRVGGTVSVAGNTSLSGSLWVGANTYITGTLEVTGAAGFNSTANVKGALTVTGSTSTIGAVALGNTLTVQGDITATSSLHVHQNASVSGAFRAFAASRFDGPIDLRNNTTLTGSLTTTTFAVLGGALSVQGTTALSGALYVGTNAFVTGTLQVTGAVGLSSSLEVRGASYLKGLTLIDSPLQVTGAVGFSSSLEVRGATTLRGVTEISNSLDITGVHTSTNATEATSTSTGAIISAGGMGLSKNLWVGGTLNVAGAVTLGTITGNLVNALSVDDSSLQLNTGTTYNNSGARTISVKNLGITNAMLAGSIANAKLSNSSVTIGTTAISLGNSSTTLAGLTSVTSTTFVGAITGNADTATKLATGRTIAMTGDVVWTSPSFDGSGNVTAASTISNLAVTNAMLAGSIANAKLANSSITIAGTATALGGSITANTIAGAISNGTITNAQLANSSITVTAGTGMSGGGAVSLGSSVTLTNAGVTSIAAGTGITRDTSTGAVTITNSGVTSNVAGTGISVSAATGAVTVTNTGVTSAVAGTNVSVSAATGAVTINVSDSPTFTGNATAAGFFQSSKRELKTNISKFEKSALDIINNTEVVEFNYKNDLDTLHIGIIADDSPEEIATKNHDKFDTNSTVAILLKAVQEMSAEIKELKEQLANK